ncbi:MAG: hypothetical protein ABI697_00290 [Devosia sp.]
MRKLDLDHLLEAAVAKALGVSLPANRRRPARSHKPVGGQRQIRHAA